MLQTSALASARFTCFMFEKLRERFIRIVLEYLSQALQLSIAERCLVDQARKHRIFEKGF
jgi:hypothetical protein